MKLNRKKGFTIVELVIVIAVLAVLAAVLIPTFAGLIRKANVSKDTQLVRNLNTALSLETEKPTTMHDALEIAAEAGYLVDKINASASGNEILWDSKNNVFCYYNKDSNSIEYIPESATGTQIMNESDYYQLWKVYNKNDAIPATGEQKFSIYLADGATVSNTLEVKVGFDAGNNASVAEVTYTGDKSVVIRTVNGKLTVNAPNAHVEHYGLAKEVDVKAVSASTYVEHGTVANLNVTAIAGRIVVENGGLVGTISGSTANVTYEKKSGGLVLAVENDASDSLKKIQSTDEEKSAFVYEISTAAELAAFRDSVNSGMTYEGLTIKLTADIDLSGYCTGTRGWTPIGVYKNEAYGMDYKTSFNGTFDGNGKTISNLYITSNDTVQMYGALFGYISNATIKNFTINGSVSGTDVAGVVAATDENSTIDGITSYVDLTGKSGTNEENITRGKVAGIICCSKGDVTVKGCINNGAIVAINGPAAGIVAYTDKNITIENCKNTGNISVTYMDKQNQDFGQAGGIIGVFGGNTCTCTCTVSSCENTGNITSTKSENLNRDLYVGEIIGKLNNCEKAIIIIKNCTYSNATGKYAVGNQKDNNFDDNFKDKIFITK